MAAADRAGVAAVRGPALLQLLTGGLQSAADAGLAVALLETAARSVEGPPEEGPGDSGEQPEAEATCEEHPHGLILCEMGEVADVRVVDCEVDTASGVRLGGVGDEHWRRGRAGFSWWPT